MPLLASESASQSHVQAPVLLGGTERSPVETERQRICHVSLGLNTGGLERLLVDFARFHDRDRFELHFVALQDVGRPAEDIRKAGCTVHQLTKRRGLAQVRELTRLFRTLGPAVVHTHNASPQLYGTFAGRLAGVPAIVNTRHGQRFGQTGKTRFYAWFTGLFTDRIVGVSDDAARLCRREDWLPARKVQRIWNGIDLERFRYRGPGTSPVAISVARLSPEKDFATLLQAVRLAARLVPDLELLLVGDGPERQRLESLATELKIFERVRFLGERQDVPELLSQAGFFVSSSLTEGVSLTLLEAMAVGLPVLATAVGGNPEVVLDGVTGQVVPPADADALAAGIVQLCRDRGRWPELGERGRQRVSEYFDVRRMVRDYETLYQDILSSRKNGRAHVKQQSTKP